MGGEEVGMHAGGWCSLCLRLNFYAMYHVPTLRVLAFCVSVRFFLNIYVLTEAFNYRVGSRVTALDVAMYNSNR